MKPAEAWVNAVTEAVDGDAFVVGASGTRTRDIITSIQRDARDGMVPYREIWPLIGHLSNHAVSGPEPCTFCERTIDEFRAKHPNLFA